MLSRFDPGDLRRNQSVWAVDGLAEITLREK